MSTKQKQQKPVHVIEIPIDDWVEEFNTVEPDMGGEDDLIKGLQAGLGPLRVSRLAMTGRQLGIAPEDILPANKTILNTGGAYTVSQIVARRHKAVKLANGNTVQTREFVGSVREEEEDQSTNEIQASGDQPSPPARTPEDMRLVSFDSPEAKERAITYLNRYVVPNIRERLKIIAVTANRDELKQVVKDLKKQIDVAVADLV